MDEFESKKLNQITDLSDQDFKIIVDAAISYLIDNDKLTKINKLNNSLLKLEDKNSKDVVKWLIKSITLALKQSIEPNKVAKHFQSSFGMNEKKANIMKEMWEKHWASLKEVINNQNLMISQLVDMEWKFGVTASTSYIEKFGNAFLQLKLVYNKGGQLENKFMGKIFCQITQLFSLLFMLDLNKEMTLPQFYSFLHEMNKAKSQMDYLS